MAKVYEEKCRTKKKISFSSAILIEIDKNVHVLTASILSFLLGHLQGLPALSVYCVVGLLVFGESALFLGFVLPGETSVLIGGVIAAEGRVHLGILMAIVVLAAISGDSVGYFVGSRYGHRLLRLRLLKARSRQLDGAMAGLKRRGPIYVFLARFTAFLRAVMPGLAGMSKMHYTKFLVANAVGGITWGVAFTLIGYYAGHELKVVEKYSNTAEIVLLALTITVISVLHILRKRREEKLTGE